MWWAVHLLQDNKRIQITPQEDDFEFQRYLYFCCDQCDFKTQRKVEFKVHLLNVHESAQCSHGKCESTEEVPDDNLESNLEETSPECNDSCQTSGSDTEKASPNAEVR